MATKTPTQTNGRVQHAMPEQSERFTVSVPQPVVFHLSLALRGITSLIMCRFDEKTKAEMEAKTEGKAKNKRAPKDPEKEWNAARYISTDGWDGIHAVSFRAAIISAARSVDGMTMTALKSAVFVTADGHTSDGIPLVRIIGKAKKFSNMCRTTTGVAYPRHRPMYDPWAVNLRLEINGHILSREAAVNLVSLAGRFCGVGEWRPTSTKSMTGEHGRFSLDTEVK